MNKIPMLERFAAQSLVEHDGELIFSKEKFAELIVRECGKVAFDDWCEGTNEYSSQIAILKHFNVGVEE